MEHSHQGHDKEAVQGGRDRQRGQEKDVKEKELAKGNQEEDRDEKREGEREGEIDQSKKVVRAVLQ